MTESNEDSRAPQSAVKSFLVSLWRLEIDWISFLLWPCVFSLNMILPLQFSTSVTQEHGKAGIFGACFMLLVAGAVLSVNRPSAARKVILGSIFIALSQFVPILQIMIGLVALSVVEFLHLAHRDHHLPQIDSEVAGFAVTMLVGGGLLCCASALGFLLALSAPKRWFRVDGAGSLPVEADND